MRAISIAGISEYGGLYGTYRAQSIPSVDVETVKRQDADLALNQESSIGNIHEISSDGSSISEEASKQRSRIANLEDVSLNFNTGDDYSYIGSESSIGGLDIQKAISDMQKDQVLQEYQFFVGDSNSFMQMNDLEEGIVIPKPLV